MRRSRRHLVTRVDGPVDRIRRDREWIAISGRHDRCLGSLCSFAEREGGWRTDQGGPSRPKPMPWIMAPWALPFWLASVEWGWWDVFHAEFAASPPVPAASLPSPALAVSLGVIGKLMGHVSETAFYV